METTPDRFRRRWLSCVLAAACLGGAAWPAQTRGVEKQLRKDYALIVGTVWDREDHAVYGAIIKIRRAGDKKARWELISDHSGEFAQRLPAGAADYLVWVDDTRNVTSPAVSRRKLKPGEAETKVHIENDERVDISLHLTE